MNCACYGRLHEGEKADNGDTEDDTIICPKCGSDDAEECRQLDRDGALLGTWKSCPRCEHQWDVNF